MIAVLVLMAISVEARVFPEFDTEALCEFRTASKSPRVVEGSHTCLNSELAAKEDWRTQRLTLSQEDRFACEMLASNGGGSYFVASYCGSIQKLAYFQRMSATNMQNSEFKIEKAPDCKDGSIKCAPWDRAWTAENAMSVYDWVSEDGMVYRVPE